MPTIDVRIADTADAPFVSEMIWEAIAASPELVTRLGAINLRSFEARMWSRWIAAPREHREPVFIAHDATRSLGAILLKNDVFLTDEDRERRSGAIAPGVVVERWRFGMGVVADARGRGVGRALLAHALAFARAQGSREMSLLVDPKNATARALYDAMGFVVVGDRDGAIEMRVLLA